MSMKFGHRITGRIDDYDDKGRGTFEIVNQDGTRSRIAVPFSASGDEVVATFVKREHGVKVARIETLTKAGPDRIEAPCPHAGVCGGCLWQHLSYEAQIELKKRMVNAAFEKTGHGERIEMVTPCPPITDRERLKIDEMLDAGASGKRGVPGRTMSEPRSEARTDRDFRAFHRNRMDYAVGWNGEIGLKEYGSWNRYVDLKTCLLLNDGVGKILECVRGWMKTADLQPWDAKFYSGDVRYVVIREGKATKERMIVVVLRDLSRATDAARRDLLDRLSPFATSILLGEQSLKTDVSLSQRFEPLKGNPWIEEVVNGVRYRIAPNAFFQTNSGMAAALQNTVAAFVGAPSRLLDLYCGLGFFGIFLAVKMPSLRVSGFEIDAGAIALATQNAEANGVSGRCDFVSGPAEDLSWKEIDADAVILDPPRSGLHPRVLKTVLEKRPETIVYVSCNVHRLAEELKDFKTAYRVERLAAIDLFPHTPHVEVVAKLVLV